MSHAGGFLVFTVWSFFMLKFGIWLTAQIKNVAFFSFSFGDNLFIFWKNATNTPYFLLLTLLHQYANLLSVCPPCDWFAVSLRRLPACTHARCLAVSTRPSRSPQLCARALHDRHRRNHNQEPRRRRRRRAKREKGDALADASELQWRTKVSTMETGRLLRG